MFRPYWSSSGGKIINNQKEKGKFGRQCVKMCATSWHLHVKTCATSWCLCIKTCAASWRRASKHAVSPRIVSTWRHHARLSQNSAYIRHQNISDLCNYRFLCVPECALVILIRIPVIDLSLLLLPVLTPLPGLWLLFCLTLCWWWFTMTWNVLLQ